MFDNWKLGEYMDAAYQVSCEWYPNEEDKNKNWILEQMRDLTPETTLEQSVLALLIGNGTWDKFWHHDRCDFVDTKQPEDCVACHIIKAFEENVVNQKVIIPKGYHDVEEFYPENEDE